MTGVHPPSPWLLQLASPCLLQPPSPCLLSPWLLSQHSSSPHSIFFLRRKSLPRPPHAPFLRVSISPSCLEFFPTFFFFFFGAWSESGGRMNGRHVEGPAAPPPLSPWGDKVASIQPDSTRLDSTRFDWTKRVEASCRKQWCFVGRSTAREGGKHLCIWTDTRT